jgi:hypothetical protein
MAPVRTEAQHDPTHDFNRRPTDSQAKHSPAQQDRTARSLHVTTHILRDRVPTCSDAVTPPTGKTTPPAPSHRSTKLTQPARHAGTPTTPPPTTEAASRKPRKNNPGIGPDSPVLSKSVERRR